MIKQMEVTKKVIGENTFYIKPFAAFTAANITGELAGVITPILGGIAPMIGNASKPVDILDMDMETALPSLSNAFSSLSGEKFERLMKKLLIEHKNVSVESDSGNPEILSYDLANEVFCGDVQDMYVLCFEIIKINYSGFFKKLGTRFGNLAEILNQANPSSTNTESLT